MSFINSSLYPPFYFFNSKYLSNAELGSALGSIVGSALFYLWSKLLYKLDADLDFSSKLLVLALNSDWEDVTELLIRGLADTSSGSIELV